MNDIIKKMKRISPYNNPFWKQTTGKRKSIDNPFKRKYQIPFERWAFEDFLSNDGNKPIFKNQNQNQNNSIIKNIVDGVSNVSRNIVDRVSTIPKTLYNAVKHAYNIRIHNPSTEPELLVGPKSQNDTIIPKKDPKSKNDAIILEIGPMPKKDTKMTEVVVDGEPLVSASALQSGNPRMFLPVTLPPKIGVPLTPLNLSSPFPYAQINPNPTLLSFFQEVNGPPSKRSRFVITDDPSDFIREAPQETSKETIQIPQTQDEIENFKQHLQHLVNLYTAMFDKEKLPVTDHIRLGEEFDKMIKIFDLMSITGDPKYRDLIKNKSAFGYYRDDLLNLYRSYPKRYDALRSKFEKIQDREPELVQKLKQISDNRTRKDTSRPMIQTIQQVSEQLRNLLDIEKDELKQSAIRRRLRILNQYRNELEKFS